VVLSGPVLALGICARLRFAGERRSSHGVHA
jgi:hypothetical protein